MKLIKLNTKLCILLILATIFLLSSCQKDEEDNSLTGTVWVSQYKAEEHMTNGISAKALVFGKDNVEVYYLDANNKIINLITTYNYKKEDQALVIGNSREQIGDNYLYLNYRMFYYTDKKFSDLLN
ncbi:hypothetical protein [uncultured Bacteroides sp.]|uniref:hypothetical protein n=1 Tax=uncultured Bacteroides sp. TaxID=162156 RepID=UPI002AAA7440|nr:hypothetical protein [uncultured Bacteroides sp.]